MPASSSHRRTKHQPVSAHPAAVLEEAHVLLNKGLFNDAIDLYERLAATPDLDAIPILAELFDVYQCIRAIRADRYTLYQSRIFDFSIGSSEKVLDVGSGHHPFPLATHLSDITATDDHYGRAGVPFKHIEGKPVYEFNIESIPLGDGEFDFTYCSHVLEHTNDPAAACKELMRVSRRGYIETPTASNDLWLCNAKPANHTMSVELCEGDCLLFRPYTEEEIEGIGSDILRQMHVGPQTLREKAFSSLIYLFPERINSMLYWERKFRYAIRKSDLDSMSTAAPQTPPASTSAVAPPVPASPQSESVQIGTEYGGWHVFTSLLNPRSIVYCVGIGEDISFDRGLIEATGVTVRAFDPTPKSLAWLKTQTLPNRFMYFGIGLMAHDGTESFRMPTNPDYVSCSPFQAGHLSDTTITVPVNRLTTLMEKFGHEELDLLKIDIEGSEYVVIDDMLACGILPRQLLIEFHHRFESIGPEMTRQAIRKLEAAGYRVFHQKNDFQEVGFRLSDSLVPAVDATVDGNHRSARRPV